MVLLLYTILLASCSQENEDAIDFTKMKLVQKDTLIQINEEHNNERKIGTRYISTEYAKILHYDIFRNGNTGKNQYYFMSLFSKLSVDTISNDLGILTQYPFDQHYKDKIIINSFISHRSFIDSQYTAPKELIDCRVLKDLNTNKVEKIVVYIDSVEYILDANNIQKK